MFNKAYLIRAFYQWCLDNKYEPQIQVFVSKDSTLQIPKEYIAGDGTTIINISKQAVKFIEIENDKIYVEVSYNDEPYKLGIDINIINWMRVKEIEEYLYLNGKYESYVTAVQKNLAQERKKEQADANKLVGMKPEIIQDWIVNNSESLAKLMCLTDWYIKYVIVKQEDKISKQNESDPDGSAGDCQTSYEYKSATIRIFAAEVKNEEELKRVVVHELAHVATSSFELYSKYFENTHLYLDNEKEIAKKLRYDIYELLAMQIENIVMGKHVNKVEIWETSSRADAQFRMHCKKYGVTSHNVITDVNTKPIEKTPLEIVEEENKYDPDFWWRKYRESSKLVEEKKSGDEKKEDLYSFLSKQLDKQLASANAVNKIIISDNIGVKKCDFNGLILLNYYKNKAA